MGKRILVLDLLKTIAIIGVVLFHIGLVPHGYLGVEIFFVVSGFLFAKSSIPQLRDKSFNPVKFILKKLSDYWPLVLAASMLCMIIGFWGMLPDDFENLSESAVAANVFASNVLQAITTRNYWGIANRYRPLMHTWYISVLLQVFVFLAVVLWFGSRIFKKDRTLYILGFVTVVSLLLYLASPAYESDKFYYFQYRLFEITIGAILVFLPKLSLPDKTKRVISVLGILGLSVLLFVNLPALSNSFLLITTVFLACITVYAGSWLEETPAESSRLFRVLSIPAKYSYDIYIWHQAVSAFLYYFFFQELCFQLTVLVIFITVLLSFLSAFLRKRLLPPGNTKRRLIFSVVSVILTTPLAFLVYVRAGVVRDVPELGVDVNHIRRNMHSEYVDIPYSWDRDFADESKLHILVMGNSFGRDFANLLAESSLADQLEISYISGKKAPDKIDRFRQADFIFQAEDDWSISDWILENADPEKLYIVGNKEFGNSNGIIYINRNQPWYFDQKVELSEDFLNTNNEFREKYGSHYIDMIGPLLEGNRIAVFTDDHYYISQDGRHLTKYGARYYSRILDLSFIAEKK